MAYDFRDFSITQHAMARCQQRGIPKKYLELIYKEADREFPTNDNALSITISKNRLKYLVNQRKISPKEAEKIFNVVLIEADGTLITVFHSSRKWKRK